MEQSEEKKFQLHVNCREWASGDILEGDCKVKVLSDPEPYRVEIRSRWWIVRWWRKLWSIKKYDTGWKYTVKLITDGTR